MIATKYRVPKNLIPYILRKGNEFASKLFIIREKENNLTFSRYRVIISGKVSRKAVERNKLRRRAYEAIRNNQDDTHTGNDFILIGKKRITDATYKELENDLKNTIISQIKQAND